MKKLFIPLTLEKVGSEGKFFTDNTVLKFLGTVIIGVLVGVWLYSCFAGILPTLLLLPLCVLAAIIPMYYLMRFWVVRERALFKLLKRLTQHKVVNVGEFSDIYTFSDEGIALYNSGFMSGFIRIIRGSTLGMTEQEKEKYYLCLKFFEDSILANGYTFKVYNCESPKVKDTIFTDQRDGCRRNKYANLENNLNLKNTYTKVFMENCLRDELFVYCVVAEQGDTDHFKLKLEQACRNLTNRHIKDAYIMSKEEINEFAKEYTDVEFMEFDSDIDEEMEDVLKVEL